MMTTQINVSQIGCSAGKPVVAYGFGLPHRSRQADASALTGFHSAIGCSQFGKESGGTKTFEMKVIGKSTVKPTWFAASTVRTVSPSQIPTHDIAKANSSSNTTPAKNSGTLV